MLFLGHMPIMTRLAKMMLIGKIQRLNDFLYKAEFDLKFRVVDGGP